MADRDDPLPSYDPRSWTGGAGPPPKQDVEASFDPHTWTGTKPPEERPAPSVAPAKPGRAGSLILAGSVALILFSVGGAAAYLARQDQPPKAPPAVEAPQPEVVVEQE